MDSNVCIFCCKPIITAGADTHSIKKPTKQGYVTDFVAAEKRQDAVSLQILAQKKEIITNPESFKYHLSCRKSFCNENNIDKIVQQNIPESVPSTSCRGGNENFNIKTQCLICGKSGTHKKRALSLLVRVQEAVSEKKFYKALCIEMIP